jgi:hypothetical protein
VARPKLSNILTPERFETAILAVFREALRRLAAVTKHIRHEKHLNFALCRLADEVHWELIQSQQTYPFVILTESANQPEPDDVADSPRLEKYPDFTCAMTNEQATAQDHFRIRYYLECKRLGKAEGTWILNKNYSAEGMIRFRVTESGYGKGCPSATMIGYMQNTMTPDEILTEVNGHAATLTIPTLDRGSNPWVEGGATELSQLPLTRDFDQNPIRLHHLWVDLRHCTFEDPPPKAAVRTKKKTTKKRKQLKTKNARKKGPNKR